MYQTDVQYVSGYLPNTSVGINHNLSVGANGLNAVDGLVAMMNVKILTSPAGTTSKSSCAFISPSRVRRISLLILFPPQSDTIHAGSGILPYIRCTHLVALCFIILTLITLGLRFAWRPRMDMPRTSFELLTVTYILPETLFFTDVCVK